MKIKHWQGYGTVNAKKLFMNTSDDGITELVIEVKGNHEWGLVRDDEYDVANWLVKRFDKDFIDYRDIIYLKIDEDYDIDTHEDIAIYTINYKTR